MAQLSSNLAKQQKWLKLKWHKKEMEQSKVGYFKTLLLFFVIFNVQKITMNNFFHNYYFLEALFYEFFLKPKIAALLSDENIHI